MKKSRNAAHGSVIRMGAVIFVFVISLLATALAYERVHAFTRERQEAQFDGLTEQAHDAIDERLQHYQDVLYGIRGLFHASDQVDDGAWRNYLSSIVLDWDASVISTVAYARKVPKTAAASTNEPAIPPASGFQQPTGHGYLIFHVAPFDEKHRALVGMDVSAEPVRRATLMEARDSGEARATGKLTLFIDQKKTPKLGFLLMVPVYQEGLIPTSIEKRREAISGVVIGSFRAEDLLQAGPLKPVRKTVRIEMFEGLEPNPEDLMHDSRLNANTPTGSAASKPLFTKVTPLNVAGQTYALRFTTLPQFSTGLDHYYPVLVLTFGLVISGALGGTCWSLARGQAVAEELSGDLRRSREKLDVALRSIAEAVIATDINGRIILMNDEAENLLGLSQSEALGRNVSRVLNLLDIDTREPIPAAPSALRGGLTEPAETEARQVIIHSKDRETPVACKVAPMLLENGNIAGQVMVFRDITEELKQAEERIRSEKLESLGVLAGGIAHDFNNILTIVLGNLSFLKWQADTKSANYQRLTEAEAACWRARHLTRELLTFAKGGEPIKQAAVLPQIIRESAQAAVSGSAHKIEFDIATDIHPSDVDPAQLREALQNLVTNAVQAMPDGGIVKVCAKNVEVDEGAAIDGIEGHCVEILVRDEGVGIPHENLTRIFDPYFTTKENASGLGLSVAYSVVKKHGGSLTVESTPYQGSAFRIMLPASTQAIAVAPEETKTKVLSGQGRILIMDDEEMIRDLARNMLEYLGYQADAAREGGEAVRMYQAAKDSGKPYAGVIMDLTVPDGMGGKEAISRLKKIDPDIKAIVSSGYSNDPVMAKYKEHGFQGLLPKPYKMDQLGMALKKLLGSN